MHVYGLIGYPLTHSFSKDYFIAKFEREGVIDSDFQLFPIDDINEFPKILKMDGLHGLAVTIPYKQKVLPFLDSINQTASDVGAVNCINIKHGKLFGYNTDVLGFEKSFVPLLKKNHTAALVLGTGGASLAVQYVLRKIGIDFLTVSRNNSFNNTVINYLNITQDILKKYPIVINATPAGMFPLINNAPGIPYHFLTPENLLYDLIYSPAETLFLKEGINRGCITKNGYEMLVIQAEENWRIWKE